MARRSKRNTRAKPASLKTPPLMTEAEVQAARKKHEAKKKTNEEAVAESTDESSVVCLSHIPHGFYEGQMKKYFAQFGKVKRLRLSRSKKSGRSKGFAYIEFEFPEVAKVVADTMNGYLTYQKILKCRVLPTEKIHPQLFKGSEEKFKKPWHREASISRHNALLKSSLDRIHASQKRRVQLERRRNQKLEKLGIEYKSDNLTTEWEKFKGPVVTPEPPSTKPEDKPEQKRTRKHRPRKRKHDAKEGSESSPKKDKPSDKEDEDEVESDEEEESLDGSDGADDLLFDEPSSSDDEDEDVEEAKVVAGGNKRGVQSAKKAKGTSASFQEFISLSAKKVKSSTPHKGQMQQKLGSASKKAKASTPVGEKAATSAKKAKRKDDVEVKSAASAKKGKVATPLKGGVPTTPKTVEKVTKGKTPKNTQKGGKKSQESKVESTPVNKTPKKVVVSSKTPKKEADSKKTPKKVAESNKTPKKVTESKKTPKKVAESEKNVAKTPKSGKAKTPKSGAKKSKAK